MSINIINYALAKKDWKKAYEDLKVLEIGGRNLLLNSSKEFRIAQHSLWYATIVIISDLEERGLKVGDTVTFSVYVKTGPNGGARARLRWEDDGGTEVAGDYGTHLPENSEGRIQVTGVVRQNATRLRLVLNNVNNSEPYQSEYKEEKLEKGNKATDWTPAPEDINAHPFVAELAESVFRSKQNEERIQNLENAITALGGGS